MNPPGEQILPIGVALLAMASPVSSLSMARQAVPWAFCRGVQDTTVQMKILAGFSYWIVGMPASYLAWLCLRPRRGGGLGSGLVFGLGVGAAILLNGTLWAAC